MSGYILKSGMIRKTKKLTKSQLLQTAKLICQYYQNLTQSTSPSIDLSLNQMFSFIIAYKDRELQQTQILWHACCRSEATISLEKKETHVGHLSEQELVLMAPASKIVARLVQIKNQKVQEAVHFRLKYDVLIANYNHIQEVNANLINEKKTLQQENNNLLISLSTSTKKSQTLTQKIQQLQQKCTKLNNTKSQLSTLTNIFKTVFQQIGISYQNMKEEIIKNIQAILAKYSSYTSALIKQIFQDRKQGEKRELEFRREVERLRRIVGDLVGELAGFSGVATEEGLSVETWIAKYQQHQNRIKLAEVIANGKSSLYPKPLQQSNSIFIQTHFQELQNLMSRSKLHSNRSNGN